MIERDAYGEGAHRWNSALLKLTRTGTSVFISEISGRPNLLETLKIGQGLMTCMTLMKPLYRINKRHGIIIWNSQEE
ncbi:hypothetical protein QWZ16_12060 [Vibrio ostreicida]|uniref:Uncharacterized protein n=1 Tax=Vibrio ostreicida TaxID=526588 RepID=A0ABT8BTH2_9VIBR|nr:hypothetical protein [Vibrio ostreicida]MDN3610440.1 hypothetical protein [Vibrio ostreicida]